MLLVQKSTQIHSLVYPYNRTLSHIPIYRRVMSSRALWWRECDVSAVAAPLWIGVERVD